MLDTIAVQFIRQEYSIWPKGYPLLKGHGKEWLSIIYYKNSLLEFTIRVLADLSPLRRLKRTIVVLVVLVGLTETEQEAGSGDLQSPF